MAHNREPFSISQISDLNPKLSFNPLLLDRNVRLETARHFLYHHTNGFPEGKSEIKASKLYGAVPLLRWVRGVFFIFQNVTLNRPKYIVGIFQNLVVGETQNSYS